MVISYPTWLGADGLKLFATTTSLAVHRTDEGAAWRVFIADGPVCHETRVLKDESEEQTDFEASYAALAGRALQATIPFTGKNESAPVAADGKPFVLPNSFPGEVLLNFAGCSDKLSPAERFGGDIFGLQVVGAAGDSTLTIDLLDGIFLAGGHVEWDGGSYGSTVYMVLYAPASTVQDPASPNTGNCNLVPIVQGVNLIVPTPPGTGAKDLVTAIPIPANDEESNEQNGYWNYSEPWIGIGTVAASAPGKGKYNLLDIPLKLAHFAKIHLMRDTGARDMIAPAIKPKWILPEWKMKVVLHNGDTNKTLRLALDLLIARRKSA